MDLRGKAVCAWQDLLGVPGHLPMFCRSKKVVMQATNTAHLLQLQALASSLTLPTYLVQDTGQNLVGCCCLSPPPHTQN